MSSIFNHINMSAVMEVQQSYQQAFRKKHGVMLGHTGFFVKAACIALQEHPAMNACVTGTEVVCPLHCDISIAVDSPKGLVVPVIRKAESLSLPEIEKEMFRIAIKAFRNKLTPADMQGGTFTISNGGVFGSLFSMPIVNRPQCAILGLHKIYHKPVAAGGKGSIEPHMYLAITYNERVVDQKESTSFLNRLTQLIENPALLIT
jgi:2-oxoglutarate dehydrogenase E2 component (dihydrolipoamide succinyltransferase)